MTLTNWQSVVQSRKNDEGRTGDLECAHRQVPQPGHPPGLPGAPPGASRLPALLQHAAPVRSCDMAGDDGCTRVPCDLPHVAHRHGAAEIGKAETAEVTARGEQVEAQWL